MLRILNRLMAAVLALAWASGAVAQSRPLAVEDVVALEAFGRATISPDGRWAVYEKRGGYNTIPRFDFAQRSAWAIMDLWRIDLEHLDRPAARLLPDEGPGLLRGEWSPSGKRLQIYRFRDGRFELGVVDLASTTVRWPGMTPDIPPRGATVEWVDDDRLLVMARVDGALPVLLRYFAGSQARMTDAWRDTSLGRTPSRTVIDTKGGVATAEEASGENTLVLVDLASDGRRTLARGQIADFSSSPDGRTIAVVSGEEPLPMAPGDLLQGDEAVRRRLRLIDLETGQSVQTVGGRDIAPHLLRWSADSREVLVWARPDIAHWQEGGLLRVGRDRVVEAAAGAVSPGTDADILRGVMADWLGDSPVLRGRVSGSDNRMDWFALTEAGPVSLTASLRSSPARIASALGGQLTAFADGALWRLEQGGPERLSPQALAVRDADIGDPERVPRLSINTPPRRTRTPALGPRGESLILADGQAETLGPGRGEDIRVLAASDHAALVVERSELVETLYLRDVNSELAVDTVNGALADVVLPRSLGITHRDALGRESKSSLFLPVGGASAAKGLIVQIYPGSVDTGRWSGPLNLTYGIRAPVLVGAGYAVLSPSIPIDGPDTSDLDFLVRSVDLAVDAALAAQPDLPRGRIAILGHSFGGFAALAIATRSKRYQTYVASSAVTDLFGEWGEFVPATRILPADDFMMRNQQGWTEVGQGLRGAPPWSATEAYIDYSPFLAANRITAPVLLLTADKDYVPMSQSERLFSALHRTGGTSRLVTYWGEHHARWSPANIRDQYGQIFNWLDQTLPVVPAPGEGGAPRP